MVPQINTFTLHGKKFWLKVLLKEKIIAIDRSVRFLFFVTIMIGIQA